MVSSSEPKIKGSIMKTAIGTIVVLLLFLLLLSNQRNCYQNIMINIDNQVLVVDGDQDVKPVFEQYLKDEKVPFYSFKKRCIKNYSIYFLKEASNGNVVAISFISRLGSPKLGGNINYWFDYKEKKIVKVTVGA
jgi:hypothetical protein